MWIHIPAFTEQSLVHNLDFNLLHNSKESAPHPVSLSWKQQATHFFPETHIPAIISPRSSTVLGKPPKMWREYMGVKRSQRKLFTQAHPGFLLFTWAAVFNHGGGRAKEGLRPCHFWFSAFVWSGFNFRSNARTP